MAVGIKVPLAAIPVLDSPELLKYGYVDLSTPPDVSMATSSPAASAGMGPSPPYSTPRTFVQEMKVSLCCFFLRVICQERQTCKPDINAQPSCFGIARCQKSQRMARKASAG